MRLGSNFLLTFAVSQICEVASNAASLHCTRLVSACKDIRKSTLKYIFQLIFKIS